LDNDKVSPSESKGSDYRLSVLVQKDEKEHGKRLSKKEKKIRELEKQEEREQEKVPTETEQVN